MELPVTKTGYSPGLGTMAQGVPSPATSLVAERVTVATGTMAKKCMLSSVGYEKDVCQWELSLGPCTVLLTTGRMPPTGTHKESHLCAQFGDDHTL